MKELALDDAVESPRRSNGEMVNVSIPRSFLIMPGEVALEKESIKMTCQI